MRFRANRDFAMDGLALWVVLQRDGDKRMVAEPQQFTLKEHQRGDYCPPTLEIDAGAAQSLIDALWECGLRPTEAKYPQEHVNALRGHLEDMRRLVFKGKQ
jgi:hypothetical protein